MHRAMLQIIAGCIASGRGDLAAAARTAQAARDALRSARYEDQHQLPLARLEILLALGTEGPAAALAATAQALDRFESPAEPAVRLAGGHRGASAVLAAARAGAAVRATSGSATRPRPCDRLRTVAEKLEAFGRVQQAHQLTFAAASSPGRDRCSPTTGCLGGPRRAGGEEPAALLAAWDEAAAAWAALSEPYPLALALLPGRRSRWPR